MTTELDRLLPTPRMIEHDHVEVAAEPARVWELIRHGDLARSALVRALFALRTLPDRLAGKQEPVHLRIDDLKSSPEKPGFHVFAETPGTELCVGAIGKVWHPVIPFVHVSDCAELAAFDRPDYVKVAWAVRVLPLGKHDSRVEFELRVDATDDEAWQKFRRYFRLIGPGSHFVRHSILAARVKFIASCRSSRSGKSFPRRPKAKMASRCCASSRCES